VWWTSTSLSVTSRDDVSCRVDAWVVAYEWVAEHRASLSTYL
jgi:hypothetical protein